MLRKRLRSGYTTGACAAAAAKAATLLVMRHALCAMSESPATAVDIPFPDGSRVGFSIHRSGLKNDGVQCPRKVEDFSGCGVAWASVIKDAGDDPDVTNGAEIIAEAALLSSNSSSLVIKGGRGVGIITKPGLPVGIGEAAINPVPRKMISEAVMEALAGRQSGKPGIEITISVTDGEELAKKTLNARLGISGGLSILGTTGIVRPISADAWTATISTSMNVAKAMGYGSIVLSAGRASEKAHLRRFAFPDESYVMMGDYLELALLDAARHGFSSVHLCAQWAKMLKIAMATPQTHVRHGAIVMKRAVELLRSLGTDIPETIEFNTAREVFDFINSSCSGRCPALFSDVCSRAREYAEKITSGIPVTVHLVSYGGDIIAASGE
ncbi:MAG: cobalamin biosynthesis protein CbiD [Nitrospirae bacterium]|nr:cobalamin biosynthesis protein CbiD [Nitrospirota bacterium]